MHYFGLKYPVNTRFTVDPRTNTRSHAGVAYYEPASKRPNLHVLTEALVEKVLFEQSYGKNTLIASGLNFIANGKRYTVKAKKEVILSAGAFESPKILELSGIGSAKILRENDIEVLYQNENVGENLQDHAMVPLAFEAEKGVITLDSLRDPNVFNAALATYLANHTGLLSAPTTTSALLSYQQLLPASNKDKVPKGINNLLSPRQAVANPGLAHQYELTRLKTLNPNEATVQELFLPVGSTPGLANVAELYSTTLNGSYLTLLAVLEHPFSRGSVHIKSSDPTVYPSVDPNYLSADVDLEIFADIMLHLQTIARTEPLASLLKGKGHVFQPGYSELTESNVKAFIRNALATEFHPCGTANMSPREKGGVIDERLKVYGTKNLRVVDASIFPLHVRANSKSLLFSILSADLACRLVRSMLISGPCSHESDVRGRGESCRFDQAGCGLGRVDNVPDGISMAFAGGLPSMACG